VLLIIEVVTVPATAALIGEGAMKAVAEATASMRIKRHFSMTSDDFVQ